MVDPDAPSRKNPRAAQWLHWILANVEGGEEEEEMEEESSWHFLFLQVNAWYLGKTWREMKWQHMQDPHHQKGKNSVIYEMAQNEQNNCNFKTRTN